MKPGPEDRDLDARLRAHFAATGSASVPDAVVAAARARIARHERRNRNRGLLLVAALIVVAVGTVTIMSGGLNPNPNPGPLTPSETARLPASPTPSVEPTSVASPTLPAPSALPSAIASQVCPAQPFDGNAPLGPEFQEENFLHDESRAIAEQFLESLASLYAGTAGVDPCETFTNRGLAAALAVDPWLRAARAAETTVHGRLILRGALEKPYDLRKRPPTLSLDVIFDLAAGARFTDGATGRDDVSTIDERVGYHVELVFDGHVWRADDVGPVSEDNAHFMATPAPIQPGPPCTSLVHDPVGSPFDDQAFIWCDGHGQGRVLYRANQQWNLLTRYPCERGQAAILSIGQPLGAVMDPLVHRDYVRDPAGEFLAKGWLSASFDGHASLPADAVDTGWTNGNIDLWLSPSELERAIYLVRGNVVERWPRAVEGWGVIDCN